MEIEKQRKKIFINKVNSKLGFHISESLRDDHLSLSNFTYIVGSTSLGYSVSPHPIIHGTASYQDNIQLFAQVVQASDVLILDIRQASQEVQFILKLIQQRAKDVSTGKQPDSKKLIIIGIGSHLSWAYSKQTLSGLETEDKQHVLAKLLAFEAKKQQPICETSRSKRIPHHNWTRERQIQKSIQNLNKYSNIKSCVLVTGLVYGKDVPSPELEDILARCFNVSQEVWVYGDGANVLPTTHVDDLCEAIKFSLKTMQLSSAKFVNQLIVVDQVLSTQLQIVEQFLRNSGYVKTISKQQLFYLTKLEAMMSQSVPLKRSSQLPKHKSGSPSICHYFKQCFPQICSDVQLQIKHYVIYGPQLDPLQLQQLDRKLSSVVQVFRENDLAQQICHAKNISREQLDIHQLSDSIEKNYLLPHQSQNYVLILNQILLDINVVKKYSLNKYQLKEDSQYFLYHKFTLFQNDGNYHQPTANDQALLQSSEEKNISNKMILIGSNHKIEGRQNKQNNLVQETQLKQKKQQNKKGMPKNMRKNLKIDQFLMDNVIGYISQGFLNAGPNPELPTFIEALKKIYNRQLEAVSQVI